MRQGSSVIAANLAQRLSLEEMSNSVFQSRSDEWWQFFWHQIALNEARRIAQRRGYDDLHT